MSDFLHSFHIEGQWLYAYIAKPILIVAIAAVLYRLSGALVDRLAMASFNKNEDPLHGKRKETIRGLLKNLAKYLIGFVAVVSILDCYHVPVMAVLSTVGVVGVALAFGAQSLCKDIITGLFILFENQYFVGEYIEAMGVAGYVEQFTLRCTYLRDFDGRLHIVPNGSINLVTNHHRGNRRVMVDVGIDFSKDSKEALRLLQEVCDEVNELKKDVIRERITAQGVVDTGVSGMVIRMLGKAESMKQWDVERELRQRALETLARAGYAVPYPRTHVIIEPYHNE